MEVRTGVQHGGVRVGRFRKEGEVGGEFLPSASTASPTVIVIVIIALSLTAMLASRAWRWKAQAVFSRSSTHAIIC